jgi:pyroglutamyl-peptidase
MMWRPTDARQPVRPFNLLVTGFGPFPGVPSNPSTDVVRAVAAARPGVSTALLATEWAVARSVADLAADHEMVLMFGVAARSLRIRYERVAFPVVSRAVDAAGLCAAAAPARSARTAIDAGGLAAEARRAGFPATVSGSAGTYICNATYAAALAVNRRTLFVHIPAARSRGPLSADGLAAHALWLVDRLLAGPAAAGPSRTRPAG